MLSQSTIAEELTNDPGRRGYDVVDITNQAHLLDDMERASLPVQVVSRPLTENGMNSGPPALVQIPPNDMQQIIDLLDDGNPILGRDSTDAPFHIVPRAKRAPRYQERAPGEMVLIEEKRDYPVWIVGLCGEQTTDPHLERFHFQLPLAASHRVSVCPKCAALRR